jgi:hypothetical protein
MTDAEGTYSKLVTIAQEKESPPKKPSPIAEPASEKTPQMDEPGEDLSTIPYMNQSYRFTEEEVRWIRRQAYSLTERLGTKVSQNTVIRFAVHQLREACRKNPKRNPLVDAVSRLKR